LVSLLYFVLHCRFLLRQGKTRQDKTRQDKTRQDKTRQRTFTDCSICQTVQSVNTVRYLGVQYCSNLTFTSHINKIVAKARARASLIHKCFLSKDATTLAKAFVTYVRPILEYASVIWSPYHLGEIAKPEFVLRRFTNRLVGLHNMIYADRIHFLKLDSLEERRLRFDIAFNNCTVTRGHSYKLYAKTSCINVCHNVWNRLPASDSHLKRSNLLNRS